MFDLHESVASPRCANRSCCVNSTTEKNENFLNFLSPLQKKSSSDSDNLWFHLKSFATVQQRLWLRLIFLCAWSLPILPDTTHKTHQMPTRSCWQISNCRPANFLNKFKFHCTFVRLRLRLVRSLLELSWFTHTPHFAFPDWLTTLYFSICQLRRVARSRLRYPRRSTALLWLFSILRIIIESTMKNRVEKLFVCFSISFSIYLIYLDFHAWLEFNRICFIV